MHFNKDIYFDLDRKISNVSVLSVLAICLFLLLSQPVAAVDYYAFPDDNSPNAVLSVTSANESDQSLSSKATIYYVSTTGNDANNGLSIETAFRTLKYASALLVANDTLYVLDGIYEYDRILLLNTGTESEPITIKAYNGMPILDGINQTSLGIVVSRNYVIIDGFKVINHDHGFYTRDSDHVTVKNCTFTNMKGDGMNIWLGNTNLTIDNVTISNVFHGVHVYNQGYSYPSENITIRNSTISDASHNLLDFHTRVSNVLIENNELFYTQKYADDVGIYLHNGENDNYIIRNNYLHDMDRPIEIYNSDNVTITGNHLKNIGDSTSGTCIFIAGIAGYDNFYGVTNLTVKGNIFDNVHHVYSFRSGVSKYMNLDLLDNTYINIRAAYDTSYPHVPLYWSTMQHGYPGILTSTDQYYVVMDIINSSATEWNIKDDNYKVPESSGSGTSYTPSATSFTSSIGESTNFIVDTDEQFTSTQWYFNGAAVTSDTTSYTQNWAASGSFTVSFEGTTDLGTATRTWNVVVSGSEYSAISVVPSASASHI